MYRQPLLAVLIVSIISIVPALADPPEDIKELKLRDWHPRSMLVTKVTKVDKPMFPVIDQHNHLGTGKAFLRPSGSTTICKRWTRPVCEPWSISTACGAIASRKRSTRWTMPTPAGSLRTRRSISTASTTPIGAMRGQAAGRELQDGRQGPEVSQIARLGE